MNQMSFEFDVPPKGDYSNAEKIRDLMNDLLKFRDLIEKSMEYAHGSHSFDDITNMVIAGRLHLYTFDDCCIIMEVHTYPGYKAYHCFIACGDKEAIFEQEERFLDIARALGCKYLSLSGRHGWVREWGKRGWKHTYSTMMKEVD